jgi:hypothetical protein
VLDIICDYDILLKNGGNTMTEKTKKTRTYTNFGGEKVVEVLEVPQSFDHHILLYAKHWYKRSGNILEDLRVLLAEYSGNGLKLTSESDVKECLCNCYAEYAPMYNRGRALQEMLGWGWVMPMGGRTPEQIMLSQLCTIEGKYVDPDKLLPVLVKDKSGETKEATEEDEDEEEQTRRDEKHGLYPEKADIAN